MLVRGWLAGFYEGGRPSLTVPLPPLQLAVHELLGALLDCREPTLADRWAKEAEIRMIAAAAIQASLPWDSPPEIVELAKVDDEGVPLAVEDCRRAFAAIGLAN